jgi:hypothetical protein
MKKYKIIGGEQLGERTFTSQFLVDEDGQVVASMDEVITAMDDALRLRGEVIALRNGIENIRRWILKEK